MSHRDPLALLRDRLEGVKDTGDGLTALCPAHDDHAPSPSVTQTVDGVLVHCFAGCPAEAIVGAVGLTLADLHFERPSTNGRKWTQEDAARARRCGRGHKMTTPVTTSRAQPTSSDAANTGDTTKAECLETVYDQLRKPTREQE